MSIMIITGNTSSARFLWIYPAGLRSTLGRIMFLTSSQTVIWSLYIKTYPIHRNYIVGNLSFPAASSIRAASIVGTETDLTGRIMPMRQLISTP